jgi:hypothetical protein
VFAGVGGGGAVVGEEVEVEFVVGEGEFIDLGEAEEFVVVEGFLGVLGLMLVWWAEGGMGLTLMRSIVWLKRVFLWSYILAVA